MCFFRVFRSVFQFFTIWMPHRFSDTHKVFNGLYPPPFFRGLLSEAKASVVASKAPITLCPRYWGQKTYMLMCSKGPSGHQTEHPIKML